MVICPKCYHVRHSELTEGWEWDDNEKKFIHECPDGVKTIGRGTSQGEIEQLLRNEHLNAEDRLKYLEEIWTAMYPDNPGGYPYLPAVVVHVRGLVEEWREMLKALQAIAEYPKRPIARNDEYDKNRPFDFARETLKRLSLPVKYDDNPPDGVIRVDDAQ